MVSLTSILVDVDSAGPEHPALEHAIALAKRCEARVKIVDVLPLVPERARRFVTVDREKDLVEHRQERLAELARTIRHVEVSTEVLRGRPATALVEEVLRGGHDLIARSHSRDLGAASKPFGATDMELLRHCPCPVWLIRPGTLHRPWRIVAAVHANPEDATEQRLNGQILDWALTLREFGGARLTVIHAWIPYGASLLRSRMTETDFAEFVESTRRSENDALQELLAPLGDRLAGVEVELLHGETDDTIAQFVEARGIDVVVMGTVARTGIAGLVMGNTAERVLQRLRGSVLAIKPPGFQTPVTPA